MSSVQLPCHGEQPSNPAQDHRSPRRKKSLVPAVYANGQRLLRESSLKLQVVGLRLHVAIRFQCWFRLAWLTSAPVFVQLWYL